MKMRRVYSGSQWEKKVGYCRAVAVGSQVFVSGTSPVKPGGGTFAPNDAYAQTRRCFEIIEAALKELGLSRECITRTRMFVTDVSRWEEYGRAHFEFFSEHPPANTFVEVRRLIADDMLIEVEVDAVVLEE